MTALKWGEDGQRFYQGGIDRGVLYPLEGPGVPWVGLISVKENSTGDDNKSFYINGRRTQNVVSFTNYTATILAFSAPGEFLAADGIRPIAKGLYVTQQPRLRFGFCYRTKIYNSFGLAGHKLHIIYNAVSQPAERSYSTLGDSVDPLKLSWTFETVPPQSTTKRGSAHLIIDSTLFSEAQMIDLEGMLYGTVSTDSFLPTQDVVDMLLGG